MNQKTFSYDYMSQTVCNVFEQMINNKQYLDTNALKKLNYLIDLMYGLIIIKSCMIK